MACKYKIILRTGEVIELPSSLNDRSEFNFQEFRKVLKNLDREQLDKLFETMINAKNVPLSVQGVNLDKVIKTSSLNQILNNSTKNFFKNEISSELYQTAKGLITASVSGLKDATSISASGNCFLISETAVLTMASQPLLYEPEW